MEKIKQFRREIGENTNLYYGSVSVYEYFNYGVDLILKQFAPCEEALNRVKDGERVWEDREQALTDKYEQKTAGVQERLRILEEEEAGDKKVASLQRKRSVMKEEMHKAEERIESLSGEEPVIQNGKLAGIQEEILHREYESILRDYKAGDMSEGQKASLLQPLDPILKKKKDLKSQAVSYDNCYWKKYRELEQNASRKALQDIREDLTEQERQDPETALSKAREHIANPGDREQAARAYADASQRTMVGNVSLDSLKSVGRGIFCIPMIPVRYFVSKKLAKEQSFSKLKEWTDGKAAILKKLNLNLKPDFILNLKQDPKLNPTLIMDGISLLLNLILIVILVANSGEVLNLFLKLVPVLMIIGLLAGIGIGHYKKGNLVVYGIVGLLACYPVAILLFSYPALLGFLLKRVWPFWLWLVASVALYAAEDAYRLFNRAKIRAEYDSLLEKGREQYTALLEHYETLVAAYETALSHEVEAEKARIEELNQELKRTIEMTRKTEQELAEEEARLWEAYKAEAIAEEEERWKKSRQELEDLRGRKQVIEADIRKINEELAESDRIHARKRAEINQELDSLAQEKEKERKECRRIWEEENAQAKESYETLLASLTGQMRKDGFQYLTRNEENGVEGFDYRKAWSRIYYLITSVIGMTQYIGWYTKEKSQGRDVLADMISDAAWVPGDCAKVVSSRLVTGIERCPMSAEIREAVEEVMKDWRSEMNMCGDKMSSQDRSDYTMYLLPVEGIYKLRLNEVDKKCEEGDQYPTIFLYDFGNLDENDNKRRKLRDFALRTLCAPVLQCWGMDDSLFHIDLMLTDHKGDFENSKAWRHYGEAGRIYQGAEIEKGMVNLYQAGQRTMGIVGDKSFYERVRAMAWDGDLSEEHGRIMIATNMDYKALSNIKDEIESVLDITKMDGSRSRSGIRPYFFMDLNRLQDEDKAAAQVCLDIVKNFRGHIYKLTEKEKPEDHEEGFFDWKVVERERLQEMLTKLVS